MNIPDLLQKAWDYVSNAMTDAIPGVDTHGILEKAMQAGKSQAATGVVMKILEGVAKKEGYGENFAKNTILQTLWKKKPTEVITYLLNTAKEMGIMNMIETFFSKK